ncbi:MAG: phage tail family protein [Clostridia bacterium]|nr:phage tail family protein [Clostridia bacterium]
MRYQSNVTFYRSDGQILSLNQHPWAVLTVKGIDFPEYEVFTEKKGLGDGSFILGKRKESRQVELTAIVKQISEDEYRNQRFKAINFFDGSYTFNVEFQRLGKTRLLKSAELMSANFPSSWYQENPQLQLCFISPFSNLFFENAQTVNLGSTTKMWHNVRFYSPNHKLVFSSRKQTNDAIIKYEGTVPTYLNIAIQASGYVKGFKVTVCENSAKINTSLNAGDALRIDKYRVYKNDELIDYNDFSMSELLSIALKPGENYIQFSTDVGDSYTADIQFSTEYGGI